MIWTKKFKTFALLHAEGMGSHTRTRFELNMADFDPHQTLSTHQWCMLPLTWHKVSGCATLADSLVG